MITMTKRLLGSAALSLLMLGGCKDTPQPKTPLGVNAKHIETETAALNAWFDERYKEDLARSPMTKTYLGLPGDQDKLDDASQAAIDEEYALYQARIADMHEKFNFDRLDKQGQISYRLYEYDGNIAKALHPYADDDYVFNLMEGAHSDFPTFMVNFHKVKTPKDARNYIARLNAAKTYLGQNRERAQAQFEKGVFLPKFTYDRMINAA
ncbi:MAG TPA: DUF885 family protein, partial [Hellea balneolensis]|nr:DUF885 family protein [Hellea balneolensis]